MPAYMATAARDAMANRLSNLSNSPESISDRKMKRLTGTKMLTHAKYMLKGTLKK